MVMELGRLVNDVEVKTVGDGKKVLNNRIAIPSGNNQSTFVDIVAWNGLAEFIGTHYQKGFEILLEGRLINKKKLVANIGEIETVAIQVERLLFTHGNPRNGKFTDSFNNISDDDFLK